MLLVSVVFFSMLEASLVAVAAAFSSFNLQRAAIFSYSAARTPLHHSVHSAIAFCLSAFGKRFLSIFPVVAL